MVFKSITLKIHQPSSLKRKIMDEAISRYTQALQYMLDSAHPEVEALLTGMSREQLAPSALRALLSSNLLNELNRFQVEPFKDSLKMDFMSMLEGYTKRALKNTRAVYPRVFADDRALEERLEYLEDAVHKSGSQKHRASQDFLKVLMKYNTCNSVYFCRCSDIRDYCLLYNPDKKRYYAKLYLLNRKDPLKHKPFHSSESKLQVLGGKCGCLKHTARPERYILVPLSFGKRQQELLEKAREDVSMLRTARLVKREGEYYLIVSVAVTPSEEREITHEAGFSRGRDGRFLYTVCNLKGEPVVQSSLPYSADKSAFQGSSMEELHKLSNAISGVAGSYGAQVVLESYPQYNRLADLLSYKLQLEGLPPPVRVSPFGLSHTCPRCGCNCRGNSFMGDVFICTACGFGTGLSMLPSYNLALRLGKYRQDKVRFRLVKAGDKRLLVNRMMGLSFELMPETGIVAFFDFLNLKKEEIRAYLEKQHYNWTREDKKLYSLWKKLLSTEKIEEVIEIES